MMIDGWMGGHHPCAVVGAWYVLDPGKPCLAWGEATGPSNKAGWMSSVVCLCVFLPFLLSNGYLQTLISVNCNKQERAWRLSWGVSSCARSIESPKPACIRVLCGLNLIPFGGPK